MKEALDEQIAYYRARASEYDQWFLREGRYDRGETHNRQWFAEVESVRERLDRFAPTGDVLELACGTGLWTEQLARHASHIAAVDASPEVLEINRRRTMAGSTSLSFPRRRQSSTPDLDCLRLESRLRGNDSARSHSLAGQSTFREEGESLHHCAIDYIHADIFAWEPEREYDVVFFAFWLSHVPPDLFESFWRQVGRALRPGGRVFLVDSLRDETSTASDHILPDASSSTLTRRLNDGREFRIYKVFHRPEELHARLTALGWDLTVESSGRYFIHAHGGREER